MLTAIKRKLMENRGATLILALVLMLVCVMISSVVLAAAASGAGRQFGREEKQQAYLAVSSAAQLLKDDLSGLQSVQNPDTLLMEPFRFVGYHEINHYGCLDCSIVATMEYDDVYVTGTRLEAAFVPPSMYKDEGHLIYDDPFVSVGEPIVNGKRLHSDSGDVMEKDAVNSTKDSAFKDTILGELVMDAAEYVYCNGSTYKETFEISLNEDGNRNRLPDVFCSFVMDEEYDVTIEITTENGGYTLRIGMEANYSEGFRTDGEDDEEISCVHRVYYKNYDATNGIYTDTLQEWTIPGRKTYSNITVTWNKPHITKGVASE